MKVHELFESDPDELDKVRPGDTVIVHKTFDASEIDVEIPEGCEVTYLGHSMGFTEDYVVFRIEGVGQYEVRADVFWSSVMTVNAYKKKFLNDLHDDDVFENVKDNIYVVTTGFTGEKFLPGNWPGKGIGMFVDVDFHEDVDLEFIYDRSGRVCFKVLGNPDDEEFFIDSKTFWSHTMLASEYNKKFLNDLHDDDVMEAFNRETVWVRHRFSAKDYVRNFSTSFEPGTKLEVVNRDDEGVTFVDWDPRYHYWTTHAIFSAHTCTEEEYNRKFLRDLLDSHDDLLESQDFPGTWIATKRLNIYFESTNSHGNVDYLLLLPGKKIFNLREKNGKVYFNVREQNNFFSEDDEFFCDSKIFWDSVVSEKEYGRRFLDGLHDD